MVRFTPQSGQGICHLGRLQYVSHLLVYHCTTDFSDILYRSVPRLHVTALYFVKFTTSPYRRNRPMSTFRAPIINPGSCDTTMSFSVKKIPRHLPTASPSPSWATSCSSIGSESQSHTTLYTIRLKRMKEMSLPLEVPLFYLKCGLWELILRVMIYRWSQNTPRMLKCGGCRCIPPKSSVVYYPCVYYCLEPVYDHT